MELIPLQLESDEVQVSMQLLKLDQCAFVWIGTGNCSFNQLSAAIETRFSPVPSVVNIWGGDEELDRVIQRIVKKTGFYLVFSFNLQATPPDLYRVLEDTLVPMLLTQ
mmetsp:Transcript_1863/g.3998  ORF Transcript_1863/g.3998 Transcript_1863/m.3998 type:complete len:108 (-) Transcript_1863:120-443(-)